MEVLKLQSWSAFESAFQQAKQLYVRGDWSGAFDAFCAILSQRISAGSTGSDVTFPTQADLVVVDQTADLAFLLGQHQVADRLLSGMAGLCLQAGNLYGADYARFKRMHVNLDVGRLREAYALLRELRPTIGDVQSIRFTEQGLDQWEGAVYWPDTSRADRAILFALAYLVMGRLLASLGQYSNALVALRQGLLHSDPQAPSLAQEARIPLQLAIAGAQLEKGDLQAARASLDALEPELDEGRHPGHAAHWLERSAKLDLLRGQFGRARSSLARVREMCQQQGLGQAALQATLNLCDVLIYLNHTSQARAYLQDAQASPYVAADPVLQIRVAALLDLAQARGRSLTDSVPVAPSVSEMWGLLLEPTPELDRAGAESPLRLPQAAGYLAFFEDRTLAFHWLLGQRDLEAAAAYVAHLQQVFGQTDSVLIRTHLGVLEGLLAYYQGDFEAAAGYLEAAQPTLQSLDLRPDLWQLLRVLGWCWTRLEQPEEQRRALAQQAQALLDELAASLSGADQAVFLLNKWTAGEEYIAGQIDHLVRLKRRADRGSWFLRPLRCWRMMQSLHALLSHVDAYKGDLAARTVGRQEPASPSRSAPGLSRRLLTHPRDRATLSFLVLPDRVLVARAGWLSMDFGLSPLTRLQVRDLVRAWHEEQRRATLPDPLFGGEPAEGATDQPSSPVDVGHQISRRLAQGLQIPALLGQLPPRVRALTVVPDDSLHGFPFAAISYGGRYLAEQYALTVGFARSDGRARDTDRAQRGSLLVGVADAGGGLVPLPGVERELEQVGGWMSDRGLGYRCLKDTSARRQAVLGELPQSMLLHIACHGVFEPDRPDRSGFVLAAGDDGLEVLSLRDLAGLDLRSLRHATLSACWSADHFVLPGRWIISLPETLWRAGVHSILGSLWAANDRVAVALMQRFYGYLDKVPRDEALRRAQLDCLQGRLPACEGLDTALPVHWSAFVLYGESGPLIGLG